MTAATTEAASGALVRSPLIDPAELVAGLVYGAGADIEPVIRLLGESLRPYAYQLRVVHLSEAFPSMLGRDAFDRRSITGIRDLQDMGDKIRGTTLGDGAAARLAIYLIHEARKALHARHGTTSSRRIVWLIRSLRRPEEVACLREIYGARFILLGVHVPEARRLDQAKKRVRRWATTSRRDFSAQAVEEIRRDDDDLDNPHGQRLRRCFSLSDLIVDYRTVSLLNQTLPRLVDIVFGDLFHTPTPDEHAMYLAHSTSLRSAEMGRQVGAAITVEPFQCVALGVNEVPSPKGRTYMSGDDPDGRDFAQEPAVDSNTEWKHRVARELLARLAMTDWLAADRAKFYAEWKARRNVNQDSPLLESHRLEDAVQAVPEGTLRAFLDSVAGTRLDDLIEFGRALHAEMDAITSAARRGTSINGGTLFTTTAVCHNCARHVIASGLKRVVFLHPYSKSLAVELHGDAITMEGQLPPQQAAVRFEQFVGVTPRLFAQFFELGERQRKNDDTGEALRQEKDGTVEPRPLRAHDAWTYGGPRASAAVLTSLEADTTAEFVKVVWDLDELCLPPIPIPI